MNTNHTPVTGDQRLVKHINRVALLRLLRDAPGLSRAELSDRSGLTRSTISLLTKELIDEGWLIAPGSLFHATPRPTTLMRMNFAAGQDARFWRCLCGLTRKRRGGPGSLPHRGVVSSADGSAELTRAHN